MPSRPDWRQPARRPKARSAADRRRAGGGGGRGPHANRLSSVSIAKLLDGKRVCVCGGSGGVGKTTTSAAIALGMGARGAKGAVVTIDPAQRPANAPGLEELENEPRRVEPERLTGAGVEVSGELWAMMLDPKRTFDELIE